MEKFYKKTLLFMFMTILAVGFTACGDKDDEPVDPINSDSLIGTWSLEESDVDEDGYFNIKMTIKFNKDNTGSIVEEYEAGSNPTSKSSAAYKYSMQFSWSTTTDSSGNSILRVSYVSGDKNTELFPGEYNTVLWQRKYVLTGKILNIYSGDGVFVFKK